ncbi:Kelch repeat-containing protein [Candidatus Palauibacter sp.]|uniref:Kelch repeat-containing protein n=1 Tax=Candidatus Palauibacter sp. TaxID=3101350 RepID=UPI003AF2A146
MDPPRLPRAVIAAAFAAAAAVCAQPEEQRGSEAESPPPRLPMPVANNAVAALETSAGWSVFSFLGIDSTKLWSGVTTASFRWDLGASEWETIEPPPGPGRLAATAQPFDGRIFLFGGYTVAEGGAEQSLPQVDVLDPETGVWTRAAPMPTPVDDAISGVWRDSLIYVVSGWHDSDNVAAVQIYDPARDAWAQGTPIPGPPVFGHAGGIAGDAIVYIDGARVQAEPRTFVLETSSWQGRIDPAEPTRISWERVPGHPGPGLYRAAAVAVGTRVVFAGGSDNPYNYNGIGYDGRQAEPWSGAFAFDAATGAWSELPAPDTPTMDHRGIVIADGRAFIVGGMTAGQRVTGRVTEIRLRP